MTMLEIKGLEKTFLKGTSNEYTALRGISFTLEDGEFVTVIGSNGSGKSTLFNAVAGTFLCDKGRIRLDGSDITGLPDYKRAKKISRIFQDPMKGSAPNLTVAENIALAYARGCKHLASPAVSRKNAALFRERLASLGMGLENRMQTKMGMLSGGQRQAVTLLMATINAPRLLLLDEHTAALDPVMAERILEITRETILRQGITTMMITHSIEAALSLGTRTLMLDEGRVVLDLSGTERAALDARGLLALYREKCSRGLANDSLLLTRE
jgi:putative tryptophan/tyrosine transport system ATP-binding protein